MVSSLFVFGKITDEVTRGGTPLHLGVAILPPPHPRSAARSGDGGDVTWAHRARCGTFVFGEGGGQPGKIAIN